MVAIVVINLILKALGIDVINADESFVVGIVEALVEIGAIAAAWWYNNSYTEKARKADEFMRQLNESE
jgi:SPP1 family holin